VIWVPERAKQLAQPATPWAVRQPEFVCQQTIDEFTQNIFIGTAIGNYDIAIGNSGRISGI